ncbi:MAG: GNAT family N-acetyltransferase [Actinomycetota bacterium]
MSIPTHVHRFWMAMDALFSDVHATPWGAVLTDGRYPRVWDANYARVDTAGPVRAAQIEAELLPRLQVAGAGTMHVVTFHHEAHISLLSELSTRGHRLVWDLVMQGTDAVDHDPARTVEDIDPGTELWDSVGASLSLFGADPGDAVDQLRAIESDVMAPGGKRWFCVRDDEGRVVSLAAVLVLEGVGYIDNVATFPHARGRGYASALTDHAARHARRHGADHVILLADPDDTSAVAIYRRLGFREVGRLASTRGPVPTRA